MRLLLLALLVAQLAAVEYRWPDDANILDVKRDFGAVGDGVADDTDAIQAAIVVAIEARRQRQMVYLPAGTYRLTRALRSRITDAPDGEGGWSDGWRCGLFICGESRERTVLKLDDRAAGFGDPAKPRAVLVTGSTGHGKKHGARIGGWGNEAFQNTLMNFTVDTGSGNPGAIGVDFLASNRGCMEEVTVRSGDGAGVSGIDSTWRPWPGPALVKSCRVEGFDYGLRQKSMDCSMTYEHLTFVGQRKAVILGAKQPFMSLRGIVSDNAVPVFEIEGRNAVVNILDSRFRYTGEGEAPPAISADGRLILKGIAVEGYPTVLADGKGRTVIAQEGGSGTVDWYSAHGPKCLIEGPEEVPHLPVVETPTWHHTDFDKWASPGPYAVGSRTAGIQEAIDSGAEIVYLPHGDYRLQEPIVLRGALRKLIGCEADIVEPKGFDHVMRFVGGAEDQVIIEHVSGGGDVVHDGAGTLVIRKCDLGYRNTARGSGDAFLEDGMFKRSQVLFPQRFFARQYNSEYGSRAQLTVRHADAWILGLKVEGDHQALLTIGGVTECYALYSMTGKKGSPQPYIENREGWLAVSTREGGQGTHKIRVKDTWDNRTETWTKAPREITLQLCGQRFDPQADPPAAPGGLRVGAEAHDAVELSWEAPRGRLPIAYYLIERDGAVIGSSEADTTSYLDATADESATHRYAVRAVDLRGGRSAAAELAVETPADRRGPAVRAIAAWPSDASVVTVDFDQAVAPSAARPEAFRIEPALAVESVQLLASGERAVLRLAAPLVDGRAYTVHMSGITDRSVARNALVEAQVELRAWLLGDGLKAEFWNQERSVDGPPAVTRIDPKLGFWWGKGSPDEAIREDGFTCRWTGVLRPKRDGEHVLHLRVAGGKRLTIGDQVVIGRWDKPGSEESSGKITLEAGKRYPITIETHHGSGGAGVRFFWHQPGDTDRSFVTREHLFSE